MARFIGWASLHRGTPPLLFFNNFSGLARRGTVSLPMFPRALRAGMSMSHMISLRSTQAVTFDVGGTLIEPWPSVGHVYADVAASHGLKDISADALNRQFAEAWRALKEF